MMLSTEVKGIVWKVLVVLYIGLVIAAIFAGISLIARFAPTQKNTFVVEYEVKGEDGAYVNAKDNVLVEKGAEKNATEFHERLEDILSRKNGSEVRIVSVMKRAKDTLGFYY